MADRGLVSRIRSDSDNRTVDVVILRAGQEIVDRLTPRALEIRDMAVQDFSEDELPVLKSYLRRMYRTLLNNAAKTPG